MIIPVLSTTDHGKRRCRRFCQNIYPTYASKQMAFCSTRLCYKSQNIHFCRTTPCLVVQCHRINCWRKCKFLAPMTFLCGVPLRSLSEKVQLLQLRSLLVLLFPPDACPNIFLFRTSAAPNGKGWLLYWEHPVESPSGYCRVFLFLLPNRAERNPE